MHKSEISIAILQSQVTSEGVDLFFQVRQETGPLNGLYEFPGGKIEEGETAIECVVREVREEVGVDISHAPIEHFKTIHYKYPDRELILHFYLVPFNEKSIDYTTVPFDNYQEFLHKIPSANHSILRDLLEKLRLSK